MVAQEEENRPAVVVLVLVAAMVLLVLVARGAVRCGEWRLALCFIAY